MKSVRSSVKREVPACDATSTRLIQRIVEGSIDAVKPSTLFANDFQIAGTKLIAFGEEIDLSQFGKVKCVAIGKSAEAMAYEVRKRLGEIVTGIIGTPVEQHLHVNGFQFFKTGHPLPDRESVKAGREVERLVSSAHENELLIFLISGGGSAAIFVPVEGVTLDDANRMMEMLFDDGVSIHRINLVRRHLSRFGGGKLAAIAPRTKKLSLIISDVVGDDPASVASGPTVKDATSPVDAFNFLLASDLAPNVQPSISTALHESVQLAANQEVDDNIVRVIASNAQALNAAEIIGLEDGFETVVLTRFFEMDAQAAGEFIVSIARSVELEGVPVHRPAIILLGGETTVKLSGNAGSSSGKDHGVGGRNQHLVLCALKKMAQLKQKDVRLEKTTIFSFGTDGKDGNTDAAGASASLQTLERAAGGLDEIDRYTSERDSNSFFKKYGGLITTGCTNTNVMDIMGIVVT